MPPVIESDLTKVKVMGENRATAEMMATYLMKQLKKDKAEPQLKNCTVWELVNYFLDEGRKEGVRGDIAFCQSIVETGWFHNYPSSDPERLPEHKVYYYMNNFCGLGATGSAVPCSFDTAKLGVRAQIQHLKAYGSTEPLNYARVDPRFSGVYRGLVIYWIDFGGKKIVNINEKPKLKWASDTEYGKKIMEKYTNLMATKPDAALVAKAKNNP